LDLITAAEAMTRPRTNSRMKRLRERPPISFFSTS